jgi:hypothetical protein
MKRRTTTKRRSRFTRARREAMDLVKFIDARGGKLAPFRAYRAASTPPPPPDAP